MSNKDKTNDDLKDFLEKCRVNTVNNVHTNMNHRALVQLYLIDEDNGTSLIRINDNINWELINEKENQKRKRA